jgi:hypothetical protein
MLTMSDLNLKPEDMDLLGQALLTLTQELWVARDRIAVLEAALADAGVLPADAVDTYQPGAELNERLAADRKQLINNVLGTLAPDK